MRKPNEKNIETRYIRIRDKVFRIEDLRRIAETVFERTGTKPLRRSIEFTCSDDTAFESSDLSLFDIDSPLLAHRLLKMEIMVFTEDDRNITCHVEHNGTSSIKISGAKSDWVNGTASSLQRDVAQIPSQNTLATNWWLTCPPMLVGFAVLVSKMFVWIFQRPGGTSNISSIPPSLADRIFPVILPLGFAAAPAGMCLVILEKLWPSIEMQVGPESQLIEKKSRCIVTGILSIVIVPSIGSGVYDLIRWMFK